MTLREDWEAAAKAFWRGRTAGFWLDLLYAHVVGGASVEELCARESVSEEDFDAALALLWERGWVVFEKDYLSQRRRLKERLDELQAAATRKRAARDRLQVALAANQENDEGESHG